MPHAQVGVLAQEADVVVEVVARLGPPERVIPDGERLVEAVDVLGDAELGDPALLGDLAVAVGVAGREGLGGGGVRVVLAEMDVEVGQHGADLSRRESSATRRSCGVVTLKFSGGDGTTRTTPPCASTSDASSVAAREDVLAGRQRGLQRRPAEDLRRLHRPELRAVQRAVHDAVDRVLDRVVHRRSGDRRVAAVLVQRGERRAHDLRRHERARGVVDDHGVALGRTQRGEHGMRPLGAAGHADGPDGRGHALRAARRRSGRSPRRRAARRATTRASGGRRPPPAPWARSTQGACLGRRPRSTRPPRPSP